MNFKKLSLTRLVRDLYRRYLIYTIRIGDITYDEYRSSLVTIFVILGAVSAQLFLIVNLLISSFNPRLGIPITSNEVIQWILTIVLVYFALNKKYKVAAAYLLVFMMITEGFFYVTIYHEYIRFMILMFSCVFFIPVLILRPVFAWVIALFLFVCFIVLSQGKYELIDYVSIGTNVIWLTGYAYILVLSMSKIIYANKRNVRNLKELYNNDKILFSQLAHRLKTPLTILQNELSAEELAKRPNLSSVVKEISLAINEIDELSKVNLSKINVEKNTIDLLQLLLEVNKVAKILCANYAGLHEVQVTFQSNINTTVSPVVYVSASQIREAILNIVDHLIRSRESGKNIDIKMTWGSSGKFYVIKLTYRGVSVDPRMFDELILDTIADGETTKQKVAAGPQVARNLIIANEGKVEVIDDGDKEGVIQIYLPRI